MANEDISALKREVESLKSIIKGQRLELRAELLYAFRSELEYLKRERDDLKALQKGISDKMESLQKETDRKLGELARNFEYIKQDIRAKREYDAEFMNNVKVIVEYIQEREKNKIYSQ